MRERAAAARWLTRPRSPTARRRLLTVAVAVVAWTPIATAHADTVVDPLDCQRLIGTECSTEWPFEVHPRRMTFPGVDGTVKLSRLRWHHWGRSRTWARGRYRTSNDGGLPRHTHGRILIVLSDRARLLCGGYDHIYQRVRLRPVRRDPGVFGAVASAYQAASARCA